jgi:hypothetical protein
MGSSLRHTILRLGAQTGSLRLPANKLLGELLTHDTTVLPTGPSRL